MGATPEEMLAAMETGIVESNFTNYTDQALTDADSLGWRQERTSIYGTGPKGPTNVKASAKRLFNELRTDPGTQSAATPGLLAQAAQGSAYPDRYDAVEPQARAILKAIGGKGRKPLAISELFHDPGVNIADGQSTGAIGGHGSHVHFASEKPRDVLRAAGIASRMGLEVRENPLFDPVDPVHTGGSHHYQERALPARLRQRARRIGGTGDTIGEAIDVSGGDADTLLRFNQRLARLGGGAIPTDGGNYAAPSGGSVSSSAPVSSAAPSQPITGGSPDRGTMALRSAFSPPRGPQLTSAGNLRPDAPTPRTRLGGDEEEEQEDPLRALMRILR